MHAIANHAIFHVKNPRPQASCVAALTLHLKVTCVTKGHTHSLVFTFTTTKTIFGDGQKHLTEIGTTAISVISSLKITNNTPTFINQEKSRPADRARYSGPLAKPARSMCRHCLLRSVVTSLDPSTLPQIRHRRHLAPSPHILLRSVAASSSSNLSAWSTLTTQPPRRSAGACPPKKRQARAPLLEKGQARARPAAYLLADMPRHSRSA